MLFILSRVAELKRGVRVSVHEILATRKLEVSRVIILAQGYIYYRVYFPSGR